MLSSPKSQQKDTIPHAWWYLVRSEFTGYNAARFQKDLLAALTVAAVALPLALAYGVAAGASAAAGLVTSIVAGILVGVLGGAPASVSGPTGGLAAVLVVFAGRYGMQGVWIIGLMAGVMLIIMGIFRLGRIVALIPSPVIAGFTSGIAIIIAVGQIDNALGIKSPAADSIIEKIITYFQIDITPNPAAFGLTLLVVGIMLVWPRFRISEQIPGSLAAIMIATLLLIISGWDVPVIGTIPRSILLEDRLNFANIRWSDISLLIGPAMAVAGLGAIESLLCGVIAENATGRRPQNRVELVAQGIANLVMPFIGGIPAASALSRTSVNLKSGGLTRLAPIMHGVVLLLIALILAPIIGRVPLSALAGVLIMTAWRMNQWARIQFFFNNRLKHAIAPFLTTIVATVMLGLTQAIAIGIAMSTLIFIVQMSKMQIVRREINVKKLSEKAGTSADLNLSISVYYLSGPLFFAAARKLLEEIEALDEASTHVILSMRGVPLIDATGVEILHDIWVRQQKGGGDTLLSGLQPRVENILSRSGLLVQMGEGHQFWSTDQALRSFGGALATVGDQAIDGPDARPHA